MGKMLRSRFIGSEWTEFIQTVLRYSNGYNTTLRVPMANWKLMAFQEWNHFIVVDVTAENLKETMKTKKMINPSRFKKNTIVELNDEAVRESRFYASVKRFFRAVIRFFTAKPQKKH